MQRSTQVLRVGLRLAFLGAALSVATGGRAQDELPRLPPLAPEAAPAYADPAPWSRPVACPDHYWILSVRACDVRQRAACPCGYEIYRFEASGEGRLESTAAWIDSLHPGAPICFMSHGSFVNWRTVCEDSAQTARWLRGAAAHCPLEIAFFTWPSDDTPKVLAPVDVAVLGRRASLNSFYLADLVSHVPARHPVCLLGHSHGARLTAATLQLLAGGDVEGQTFAGGPHEGHRINAVFAAAAFDHDWLNPGERYERAGQRAEFLVNLRNRRDWALGFYPFRKPFSARSLARSGFTEGDREALGPLAVKLIDLDVTELVRLRHIWPYYYNQPSIAEAIRPYVYFQTDEATAGETRN